MLCSPARLARRTAIASLGESAERSHHTWPGGARLAARSLGSVSETPMQRRHLVRFSARRRRRGIRRRVAPLQTCSRHSPQWCRQHTVVFDSGFEDDRWDGWTAVGRRAVRRSTPAARTPARAARASRSSATARPGAAGPKSCRSLVRGHYRRQYARFHGSTGIRFSIFLAADWGVDDKAESIAQWHGTCPTALLLEGDRNPPLAIVLRGARVLRRRALGLPRSSAASDVLTHPGRIRRRLGGRRRRRCTTTSDDGASGNVLRALGVVETTAAVTSAVWAGDGRRLVVEPRRAELLSTTCRGGATATGSSGLSQVGSVVAEATGNARGQRRLERAGGPAWLEARNERDDPPRLN
jgi:hypothetical protein